MSQKELHQQGVAELAATLRSGTAGAKHQIITRVLSQAILHENAVRLELSVNGLEAVLSTPLQQSSTAISLSAPALRQRRGHQIRLVIEGDGPPMVRASKPQSQRDEKLVALIAEAYAARQLVLDNPDTSLAELANQQGKCRKQMAKLVELSCLAPDIAEALLAGNQPRSLTAARLRAGPLPSSWTEQRSLFLEP